MPEMRELAGEGRVVENDSMVSVLGSGVHRDAIRRLRDQSLGERKTKTLNSVELEMLVSEQIEMLRCRSESRYRV